MSLVRRSVLFSRPLLLLILLRALTRLLRLALDSLDTLYDLGAEGLELLDRILVQRLIRERLMGLFSAFRLLFIFFDDYLSISFDLLC